MRRRILYVHGIEAIGGAERDLITILKTLDREKWEPHVVCPSLGPFQGQLQAIEIPIHTFSLPPWRKLVTFFQRQIAVRRLRALVNQLNPALLHVNDIWWVPHALQARSSGASAVPIVAHVRQEIETDKVRRYKLNQVTTIIAISRQIAQSVTAAGVATCKIKTIYSGIDLVQSLFSPNHQAIRGIIGIPSDAVVLGTIANLFSRKGYEVMLRALPAIVREVPTAHYLIVGSSDRGYANRLMQLAYELKVADRVHLVGFQDPVQPFLACLDLYVHPALMEGFGLAVVEAMAMGKAVVATTAGGLPEVVVQGETGLLVPAGDVKSLAAAIVSLLQNPSRREAMGESGRLRAHAQFSHEVSVQRLENLYHEVLVGVTRRG